MNPYKTFTDPATRVMITIFFIAIACFWGFIVWTIFFYKPAGAVETPFYNLRAYEKHGDTRIWTYDYTTESGRTVCVMMLKRGLDTSLLEIECPANVIR